MTKRLGRDPTSPASVAELYDKIAAIEADVKHIIERQRIVDVYRSYTRGLNRYDIDLLSNAFWPDAQINYGLCSRKRDEWINTWAHERYLKGLACQAHHITNETVDIEGDVAHVESYLIAFWRPPNDGKPALILGGRYIDRLERREDTWRIAVREFIPHFSCEGNSTFWSSFTEAVWPRDESWFGAGDRSDLSYRRPLTPRADE